MSFLFDALDFLSSPIGQSLIQNIIKMSQNVNPEKTSSYNGSYSYVSNNEDLDIPVETQIKLQNLCTAQMIMYNQTDPEKIYLPGTSKKVEAGFPSNLRLYTTQSKTLDKISKEIMDSDAERNILRLCPFFYQIKAVSYDRKPWKYNNETDQLYSRFKNIPNMALQSILMFKMGYCFPVNFVTKELLGESVDELISLYPTYLKDMVVKSFRSEMASTPKWTLFSKLDDNEFDDIVPILTEISRAFIYKDKINDLKLEPHINVKDIKEIGNIENYYDTPLEYMQAVMNIYFRGDKIKVRNANKMCMLILTSVIWQEKYKKKKIEMMQQFQGHNMFNNNLFVDVTNEFEERLAEDKIVIGIACDVYRYKALLYFKAQIE